MTVVEKTQAVQLALTPAHIEALRHHVRSERQWLLGALALAATVVALMGLMPVPATAPHFWNGMSGVAFMAVVAPVADWLFWRRKLAAAIHQGVYFRVTGPIRTYSTRSSGTNVYVGDVTIRYVQNACASELRELAWGTVDYVPGVYAVIEQRDADGELLYRYHGYRPDADKFDRRPMPSIVAGILCGIGVGTLFMLCIFAIVVWIESHR